MPGLSDCWKRKCKCDTFLIIERKWAVYAHAWNVNTFLNFCLQPLPVMTIWEDRGKYLGRTAHSQGIVSFLDALSEILAGRANSPNRREDVNSEKKISKICAVNRRWNNATRHPRLNHITPSRRLKYSYTTTTSTPPLPHHIIVEGILFHTTTK